MTDLKGFIKLYKKFGITLIVNECKGGYFISLNGYEPKEMTESDKFDGYHGFFSRVDFNSGGKFIGQGFWE